jgi:hypothetical protein
VGARTPTGGQERRRPSEPEPEAEPPVWPCCAAMCAVCVAAVVGSGGACVMCGGRRGGDGRLVDGRLWRRAGGDRTAGRGVRGFLVCTENGRCGGGGQMFGVTRIKGTGPATVPARPTYVLSFLASRGPSTFGRIQWRIDRESANRTSSRPPRHEKQDRRQTNRQTSFYGKLCLVAIGPRAGPWETRRKRPVWMPTCEFGLCQRVLQK